MFVEQPGNLPAPPPQGRVAVVDVAFAAGENFEKSTRPFIEALGDRLAIWIDHHEHPLGWARFREDPRFVLVPNRIAHACPELVTPEVVRKAGPVDVVVAHADLDGLLSAVKFLRNGVPPWPEADEDARAADSPGRGHAISPGAARLSDAIDHAAAELRTAQRESLRQQIVQALVRGQIPSALQRRIDELARKHQEALAPVEALAAQAREEARGGPPGEEGPALPPRRARARGRRHRRSGRDGGDVPRGPRSLDVRRAPRAPPRLPVPPRGARRTRGGGAPRPARRGSVTIGSGATCPSYRPRST